MDHESQSDPDPKIPTICLYLASGIARPFLQTTLRRAFGTSDILATYEETELPHSYFEGEVHDRGMLKRETRT